MQGTIVKMWVPKKDVHIFLIKKSKVKIQKNVLDAVFIIFCGMIMKFRSFIIVVIKNLRLYSRVAKSTSIPYAPIIIALLSFMYLPV